MFATVNNNKRGFFLTFLSRLCMPVQLSLKEQFAAVIFPKMQHKLDMTLTKFLQNILVKFYFKLNNHGRINDKGGDIKLGTRFDM